MSNLSQIIKAQNLESEEIFQLDPVRTICGVPAPITSNHGQNFFHWQSAGLKKASVLHVDGHSDMFDCFPFVEGDLPETYAFELGIANFLCAAVHYGIVDSIFLVKSSFRSK